MAAQAKFPIDDVQVGDGLRVRAGDKAPTDGRVLDGSSSIDEAMITGESLPVAKAPGDSVIGGCLNGNGSFTMTVVAHRWRPDFPASSACRSRARQAAAGKKLADPHLRPLRAGCRRCCCTHLRRVGAGGHPVSRALAHSVAVLLIARPARSASPRQPPSWSAPATGGQARYLYPQW